MGERESGKSHSSRTPAIWLWIAGRDMDGSWWTDATWWNDYTKVLHKTGHCTRWQGMAHWKRSAVRQAALVIPPVTGWDYWFHPAVTILGLSLLAACYLSHYGHRGYRTFWPLKHYWQYVRPFRLTLREELGINPTRLEVATDRSRTVIGVPREYLGTDSHRGGFVRAAVDILGMIEPEMKPHLEGRSHEIELIESRPPPPEVLPRHVIPAIQKAREHERVYGLDKHGGVLKRSLHLDSPHICHCMPSGDGKSYSTMNIGCQHLYHGGVLIILDVKMVSHMWADGLPGVCYAYTPAMVHQVLIWLANDDDQESELTYRKRIGRKHADINGNIQTDIGPRILVLVEELNATQNALKSYWRNTLKGKGTSPASVALDDLSCTGRQMLIHLDYIPQRGSAKAFSGSGSADARENVGTWVFSNPKDSTWKMLGEGYAKPPPSDHKGRYTMMDSGGLTQFQGVLWTPEEAREFAMSGTRAQPHRDLPFTRHVGPVVISAQLAQGPAEQGIVVQQTPIPGRPEGAVTIREALDSGMFGAVNLEALRQRVTRKQLTHVGWDGAAKLYDRNDLKELIR
jgi:hypothetical protein